MRITIGGMLIISGMAGAVYFGASRTEVGDRILSRVVPFKMELQKNFELLKKAQFKEIKFSSLDFKKGSVPESGVSNGVNPNPASQVPPTSSTPEESVVPAAAVSISEPKAAEELKLEEKKAPAPALKKSRPKKIRKKVSASVVKKGEPKAVTPAPSKASVQSLAQSAGSSGYEKFVGAYVTLKLNTGNEVRGILKEITSSDYKVELPGLGDFPYLHSKVKSIELAK